jgi:hydrogenase nickel incorporation protein HypA/HybF
VHKIKIQVGALAAVVPESLEFCFGLIIQDTPVTGVILEIETVPVVVRCHRCQILFEVEDHIYLCPECGEPSMDLISGRELTVLSIEGETGEGNGGD